MTIVLSHLNSVWNPFLYAWGMSDFRLAMRRLLRLDSRHQRINGSVMWGTERSAAGACAQEHSLDVVAPLTPRMNRRADNGTATSLTTTVTVT